MMDCRIIVFLSISLKHVPDVRGAGRIGEDRILEIARCQAAPDCQCEHIDHLVDMRSDKVCAEDAVGLFLDEYFETVDGLGDAPSRVPVRGFLMLHSELEALLPGLLFAKPDRCNGRDREGD